MKNSSPFSAMRANLPQQYAFPGSERTLAWSAALISTGHGFDMTGDRAFANRRKQRADGTQKGRGVEGEVVVSRKVGEREDEDGTEEGWGEYNS